MCVIPLFMSCDDSRSCCRLVSYHRSCFFIQLELVLLVCYQLLLTFLSSVLIAISTSSRRIGQWSFSELAGHSGTAVVPSAS